MYGKKFSQSANCLLEVFFFWSLKGFGINWEMFWGRIEEEFDHLVVCILYANKLIQHFFFYLVQCLCSDVSHLEFYYNSRVEYASRVQTLAKATHKTYRAMYLITVEDVATNVHPRSANRDRCKHLQKPTKSLILIG